MLVLAVGCAGALGAVARYLLAEWTSARWRGHLPRATMLINVSGAFALGVLVAFATGHASGSRSLITVAGTGFLGGYTTFSTLAYETHALTRAGKVSHAWLHALGTLIAGVVAAFAGIALGHLL